MTDDQAAKRTVLIVDDEENLLTTLSDYLEFEGYAVRQARSGEEALRELKQAPPDLMVLDMRLPGMGGEEVLEAITDADGNPALPVLVFTARSLPPDFFQSFKVAAALSKPCDLADVGSRIRAILYTR